MIKTAGGRWQKDICLLDEIASQDKIQRRGTRNDTDKCEVRSKKDRKA